VNGSPPVFTSSITSTALLITNLPHSPTPSHHHTYTTANITYFNTHSHTHPSSSVDHVVAWVNANKFEAAGFRAAKCDGELLLAITDDDGDASDLVEVGVTKIKEQVRQHSHTALTTTVLDRCIYVMYHSFLPLVSFSPASC
jgi:hypothetical protein